MPLEGKEVTFIISKSQSGRFGWKIMVEDENLRLAGLDALQLVMERIRYNFPLISIICQLFSETFNSLERVYQKNLLYN